MLMILAKDTAKIVMNSIQRKHVKNKLDAFGGIRLAI